MGRKKAPSYRIVVAESSMPRDGRFVEAIGHYNPRTDPVTLVVDRDKAKAWISKGAKPTETVHSLLKRAAVYRELTPAEQAAESAAEAAKLAARRVGKAAAGAATAAKDAVVEAAEAVAEKAGDAVEAVKDAAEAVVERVTGGEGEESAAEPTSAEA
jgi:small subunit ribosomal protein S16